MASTYTANTGIELIANGEQSGTWGDTTNLNLEIIDRLTNGVGAITLSGTTHTLTTADGALSPGQFKVLVFGGTPSGTNTVTISPNDQAKQYFVVNNSGQSIVLTQGSGGNVTVANGQSAIVYADGAGVSAAVADISGTFFSAGAGLSLVDSVFTNTAPDQVISITGSGLASVSGTYPNFDVSVTALQAADIGVTVQAFDANTAKLNAATSNFTGVLQNGGSNVVVDTDIGATVLAFDTNLQGFVSTFTLPTTDTFAGRVLTTDGAGNLTLAVNPSGGGVAFNAF